MGGLLRPACLLLTANLLTACGFEWNTGDAFGSGDGDLTLGITDGPVDAADAVVIAVTGVEIHGSEVGTVTFEFDTEEYIDLLDYQGDERFLLLDGEGVESDDYDYVRLLIDEGQSYIEINGLQYTLSIPSSSETGLRVNHDFTIDEDVDVDLTLDFDLRKSVVELDSDSYQLEPSLRIADTETAGTLTGTISDLLVLDSACNNSSNNTSGNAVYLFQGSDASIQDIQGITGDPYATASVDYDSTSEEYSYQFGWLPAGDYSAVFTCDALIDSNIEDNSDEVVFTDIADVLIEEDTESVVDFD